MAWAVALGGYGIARRLRVTPEKVLAYLRQVDLSKLSGPERAKALRRLAAMLNALTLEQRREARFDAEWNHWLGAMTEPERLGFMEATLPTGFKQVLAAFEEMPADRRQKAIDQTVKGLREARRKALEAADNGAADADTNAPPEMSPEMQRQVVQVGLKTFFDSGSAQAKAELAPVLEELQQDMESGRLFRPPRPPRPE